MQSPNVRRLMSGLAIALRRGRLCRGSVVEIVVKFVDEAIDLVNAPRAAGQVQKTVILYVSKRPRYEQPPMSANGY